MQARAGWLSGLWVSGLAAAAVGFWVASRLALVNRNPLSEWWSRSDVRLSDEWSSERAMEWLRALGYPDGD